jgi:hypothetical protein
MVFVAIGTPDDDGLPIYSKDALLQFDIAEAHPLLHRTFASGQDQLIKIWGFGGPLMRVLHVNIKSILTVDQMHFGDYKLSGGIMECQRNLFDAIHFNVYRQYCILIVFVQMGPDSEVLKMMLWKG